MYFRKNILSFFIFFLITYYSYSQNSISAQKASAFNRIIDELVKMEKDKTKTCVVINLTYSPVIATRGIFASMDLSNYEVEDTLAESILKDSIQTRSDGNDMILVSFKEFNFTKRYNALIKFSKLLDSGNSSDSANGFRYIEINSPIEGWEWCDVLIGDSTFSGESYMSFQSNIINIPVYSYFSSKRHEEKVLYLFRFKMTYDRKVFKIEYVGKQIIG